MNPTLSPALLTPDSSLVLILDYQAHVMKGVRSGDAGLIELNTRALARASRLFEAPTILSTIGVKLRGDHPTLPSIRGELADQPELDRNTMNAWEDAGVREAVARTGRRRLIFAGLWTEVCLLYPVLHAQLEGFETYFVRDAVGGQHGLGARDRGGADDPSRQPAAHPELPTDRMGAGLGRHTVREAVHAVHGMVPSRDRRGAGTPARVALSGRAGLTRFAAVHPNRARATP